MFLNEIMPYVFQNSYPDMDGAVTDLLNTRNIG